MYKYFKDKCTVFATDIDLNEPWLKYLDVSSGEQVRKYFQEVKPDFIIHLAALTDMEYCENHPEEAYKVNSQGTKNLAGLAAKKGIPFVYISTAGIFDGRKEQYSENDKPSPLSIYGKSKYEGELAARSINNSIVIRAGWMMGGGPAKDKKFINKIIKQLQTGVSELAVVDDKSGTPTYTYDLVKIIYHLLSNRLFGLYHGVCDGGGSRYEIANSMLKYLNLEKQITVNKVSSKYFKKTYFAPRPASEKLVNLKLKKLNANLTRDWQICLKEYLVKFDWGLPRTINNKNHNLQ